MGSQQTKGDKHFATTDFLVSIEKDLKWAHTMTSCYLYERKEEQINVELPQLHFVIVQCLCFLVFTYIDNKALSLREN